VLNRGNGRAEVFHKTEDYIAFLDLVAEAGERLPMAVKPLVEGPGPTPLVPSAPR
jgi:hypothetical protein